MSNRFNRPQMLKRNRNRYRRIAWQNQALKAARLMVVTRREAKERELDAMVEHYTRDRPRPPFLQRMINRLVDG